MIVYQTVSQRFHAWYAFVNGGASPTGIQVTIVTTAYMATPAIQIQNPTRSDCRQAARRSGACSAVASWGSPSVGALGCGSAVTSDMRPRYPGRAGVSVQCGSQVAPTAA